MNEISRIGMDTSKQIFQLHGVDTQERVVLRRRLRRREVVDFFAGLAPTVVGLEACGGSHHWIAASLFTLSLSKGGSSQ